MKWVHRDQTVPEQNGQIQVDKKQCRSWAGGAGGEKYPENNLRGCIGSQIDVSQRYNGFAKKGGGISSCFSKDRWKIASLDFV